MDKGRGVDEGTHEELLTRGGIYAHLHYLQFRAEGPTADEIARRRAGRALADATQRRGEADPGWLGRIVRLFGR